MTDPKPPQTIFELWPDDAGSLKVEAYDDGSLTVSIGAEASVQVDDGNARNLMDALARHFETRRK